MFTNQTRMLPLAAALLLSTAGIVSPAGHALAQAAPASAAPRQSGTVKAVTPNDLVLTSASGQDFAVTVPATTKILLVPPGARDLSAAQPGTIADIAGGDKAIVNGTAGDSGQSLTATRILVMKSTAIAASHAADEAAWGHGAGGIVRSVDPATGVITLASGMRTLTIDTSAKTVVRHYAGSSVRFEDAVKSNLASIRPGDQMRVRGERSADGTTIIADEVVAGSFSNFSGVLSAIDAAAGTVTLKDLATKRTVIVAVTPQSNLRRLPPGAAQAMGGRGQGGPGGEHGGASTAPGAGPQTANGGQGAAGEHAGYGHGGGAGMDLSRILNRLPTETLAELKPGDAVMIVAANSPESGSPVAITMLSGVEQVLAAHPSGETTLSPWSLGSAPGEGGEGGEGGGGR